MLQNVNIKTRVRKRKRKIVVRLILLQLVLLAFASHYARAKFWGIVKYYFIELFGVFCLVYVLSLIKEKVSITGNKEIVKDLDDCSNISKDEENPIVTPIRTYNFNWVIKSEPIKKEEKNTVQKSEKVSYVSPFEGTINTDKKVLYKSPFEPLHKRVVLVLDSAMDDFCYKLRYNDYGRVFFRKKENFRYKLRKYNSCRLVRKQSMIEKKKEYTLYHIECKRYHKKVINKKKEYTLCHIGCKKYHKKAIDKKIDYTLCHFVPKKRYNKEYQESEVGIMNKDDDMLLKKTIDIVLDYERASVSFIERKLNIGYLEALRLLDKMEEWGIIAKDEGSEERRILTTKKEWLELNM